MIVKRWMVVTAVSLFAAGIMLQVLSDGLSGHWLRGLGFGGVMLAVTVMLIGSTVKR